MAYRCTVYKFTFPDKKVYIGSTSNIKSRWANQGSHYRGSLVGEAIQRFGWDNIKKECIIKLPSTVENESICLAVERELIKAYSERSYNTLCTESNNHTRTKHLKKGFPKLFWEIDDKTLSAVEWCKRYNMHYATVLKRINKYGLTP